jgi:hypothetical protein
MWNREYMTMSMCFFNDSIMYATNGIKKFLPKKVRLLIKIAILHFQSIFPTKQVRRGFIQNVGAVDYILGVVFFSYI